MPGSKYWCFTLYDYELKEKFINYKFNYLIMGDEICPKTKNKHLQCYWEFNSVKEFDVLVKHFPKVHFKKKYQNSTREEARDYCKKDGKWEEWGTWTDSKPQGFRTDLSILAGEILDNGLSPDTIAITKPELYHKYGRTFNKLEDIAMRSKYRTEMTKCKWIYGPTGAGKSHMAFENYKPNTHYVLNLQDKGWWEGYAQQETVIINEFRGQIPYSELLDLIDKYPKTVPRRGREPLPFVSKMIIITSSMSPEDVYHNLSLTDSLEQLKRRIEIIHVGSTLKGNNTEPLEYEN